MRWKRCTQRRSISSARRGAVEGASERVRSVTIRHLVLVCDTAFIDGGSAQVALTSALELADRGYRVTIFAGVGPALPDLLAHPNVDVVCLDQKDILSDTNRFRAATQGLWNLTAARAFDALLARCDREETVVHVHS